ncbi:MAG: hypothetical protein QNJ44_22655 [Rhodobacter sp.]|nr:hypothetical protein [Rhodobacter sp.]
MVWVFSFWLFFAVLTAVAAGARGRNWFLWLIWGVLFGPFAWLLGMSLRDRHGETQPAQPSGGSGGFWILVLIPACAFAVLGALDSDWIFAAASFVAILTAAGLLRWTYNAIARRVTGDDGE